MIRDGDAMTIEENSAEDADFDEAAELPHERSLLIVEDDKPFLTRLTRAMEARGFAVTAVETVAEGLAAVEAAAPPSPSSTCGSATAMA